MRGTVLRVLPALVLVIATTAQAVTFYLHESGSPVSVPGGTTTFVLDENPPVAATPVAESVSVSKNTTGSFPTFIAPAFAAPAALGLDFDVVVDLSGNLAMNNCAAVAATIERVDTGGGRSLLAHGAVATSLPQGGAGGTMGFAPVTVSFVPSCAGPFEDVTIDTGESIAVTVSVSNNCNSNRTAFLAYDGTAAPSSATFEALPPPDPGLLASCFRKCRLAVSKSLVKFVGAKAKCYDKCNQSMNTGRIAPGSCLPPAPADPATQTCIFDPAKGAEAKARAGIVKACDVPGKFSCPFCYTASDCTTGEPFVGDTEAQIDPFDIVIYCVESGGGTPTKDVAKCEASVSKALVKFVGSNAKCYDKCNDNMTKGSIPPGSCDPPAPADPATLTCIFDPAKGAEAKAAALIDKACANVSANPPCYGTALDSGIEWVSLAEGTIDPTVASVYCSLP